MKGTLRMWLMNISTLQHQLMLILQAIVSTSAVLNCNNPMDIRDINGVETLKVTNSRVEYNPFPGGFRIVPGRSLHIEFRTSDAYGLIFLVGNFAAADLVSVYLSHGHLMFARRCSNGRAFEIYRDRLDDNRWHKLVYYHNSKGGRLSIDGKDAFRQYHIGPCSDFTSVLFGGLTPNLTGRLSKIVTYMLEPYGNTKEEELMERHRFHGCLRNMRIDDKIPAIQPHYYAVSECSPRSR